ncbi:exodeoxyribonuclease VII small subunit [bacterium]|nr:exodeoxyribonuclease VII small subunit [bacterium]
MSFEEAFQKLEQIADRLESGEVPLEESMRVFEEGVALVKVCTEKLDAAEAQLQKLVKSEDGFQLELMGASESSD